uniref:NADH-ubiquinone oxidoreductase chain 4 n=1 Tax=Pallisentis celatus TaxID=935648 RepID=V5IXA6_PALCE|nr:NADH dehydrogenase subunit 4 [Pallisentis celatus]AFK50137.1 NADH dehydrogenase subunit 4 [Pallisentis celatus]
MVMLVFFMVLSSCLLGLWGEMYGLIFLTGLAALGSMSGCWVYQVEYFWLSGVSFFMIVLGLFFFVWKAELTWKSDRLINLFLLLGVFGSLVFFVSESWLLFLVMYEASLFFLVFMVLGSGGYYERLKSGYFLLIYTLLLSTPLFIYVLVILSKFGVMGFLSCSMLKGFFFLTCLLISFLVKVPLYGLHGWLPKVHVEAPTAGSMLLAGMLIKMGLWGMLLLGYCGLSFLVDWLWGLVVAGLVVSLFKMTVLTDLKQIVAYSSVVHMALVIMGVLYFPVSVLGVAMLMMVFHGVVSMGMFCGVGGFTEVVLTRALVLLSKIFVWGGCMGVVVLSLFVLNSGFPLSGGFIGEVSLMMELVQFDWVYLFGVFVLIFLGLVFNVIIVLVLHGREVLNSVVWGVYVFSLMFSVVLGVVGLFV